MAPGNVIAPFWQKLLFASDKNVNEFRIMLVGSDVAENAGDS
jgi:hypothetical protein